MNGFHTEIRDRLLGMVSHISVSEPDRRLEDWRGLAEQLEQNPEVVASAPFIEGQGMLLHRDRVSGVGLRGMLPALEAEASRIAEHIKKGSLDQLEAGAYRIVLGDELARHLNVRVGDQVTLIVPRAASTIAGLLPKFRRFEVVGIFDLDMRSYDRHLALVHLDDARQALALGEGEVGGLKVRLQDLFKAPWLADQLREELGGALLGAGLVGPGQRLFQGYPDGENHAVPSPDADRSGGGVQHYFGIADDGTGEALRYCRIAHPGHDPARNPPGVFATGIGDRSRGDSIGSRRWTGPVTQPSGGRWGYRKTL